MAADSAPADPVPVDAARAVSVNELVDRMLAQLAGEMGAAIVSRDLHDLPGVLPLGTDELADVLLRVFQEGGLAPTQCRLLALLDDSATLSPSPPEDWAHQAFDRATLYLFTADYVHTVVSHWEEYLCPLAQLWRPGGTVLVTYRCERPPEAIEHGWEYGRELVLSVAVEQPVSSH